jgi:ketosteroid isomerase-like protein
MRTKSDLGIDDLYAAWSEAFRRQDIDAVVALMTPDYILWAPGAAELDAEGLRPRLKAAFAAYEITSTFECIERLVAGDLAVERGWDVQRLRSRTGGEEIVKWRVAVCSRNDSGRTGRVTRRSLKPTA